MKKIKRKIKSFKEQSEALAKFDKNNPSLSDITSCLEEIGR